LKACFPSVFTEADTNGVERAVLMQPFGSFCLLYLETCKSYGIFEQEQCWLINF